MAIVSNSQESIDLRVFMKEEADGGRERFSCVLDGAGRETVIVEATPERFLVFLCPCDGLSKRFIDDARD